MTEIKSISPPQKDYIPKEFRKVAREMEKQFLEFMIEQMSRTSNSEKPSSTAMSYYKGLLLGKRADIMSRHHGGMGLQELILDQIYPKEKRNKSFYDAYLKAQKYSPKEIYNE